MGRFAKLETHQTGKGDEAPSTPLQDEPRTAGTAPVTYAGLLGEAEDLFYQGKWHEALRYYSRALEEDTTRPEPWIGQVLALLFDDQTREADAWARRGMECFPHHPAMVSLHAVVMARQGMGKRALSTSDFAMGLPNVESICWTLRGWILLEMDNDNWVFCFTKAAEARREGDWRLPTLMGLILERRRKWARASQHFEQAVEDNTRSDFIWQHLGQCYSRLGLNRKAIEAFQHALEMNPKNRVADAELRKAAGAPLGGVLARAARVVGDLMPKRKKKDAAGK